MKIIVEKKNNIAIRIAEKVSRYVDASMNRATPRLAAAYRYVHLPRTALLRRDISVLTVYGWNKKIVVNSRVRSVRYLGQEDRDCSRGSAYRCGGHDQLPSDDTRWHHHCDKSRRSDAKRYRFFLTTLFGMRFSTREINLSASRCKIVSPTAILMIIIYAEKIIIRYVICIFLSILVS